LFREDIWIGDKPLKDLYPRIYVNSTQNGLNLGDFGKWKERSGM